MPILQNSVHPYLPNTNETQSVTVPGAASLWVLFNPISETELGYDIVTILDGAGTIILNWSGHPPAYPVQVVGDTVQIRLTSDATVQYYGYMASVTQTQPPDNPSDGVRNGVICLNNDPGIEVTPTPGPFQHGTDLYVALVMPPDPVLGGRIFKSSDHGITWAPVSGALVEPGCLIEEVWPTREQPDPNKIRICLRCTIGANNLAVIGDWDMVTDTWAEVTRTPVPSVDVVQWYVRDNVNAVDWVFRRNLAGGIWTLYAVPFSGGVWGAPVVIAVQPGYVSLQAARADSVQGRIHMVLRQLIAPPSPQEYRQLKPDHTVTAAVPLNAFTNPPQYYQSEGSPGFGGNSVIFPFDWNTQPGCWVLSPITSDIPAVSNMQDLDLESVYTIARCRATESGGVAYMWWNTARVIATGVNASLIRYRAFDGASWGPPVTWHDEDAYPSAFQDPVFDDRRLFQLASSPWKLTDGTWGLVVNWYAGTAAVYFGQGAGGGPPAIPQVSQGGFRRMVVLVPNQFDRCLEEEFQLHLRHRPRRACCQLMLWQNINWVRAPDRFTPFRKTASIPTPLPGADNLVLSFLVPHGYDGVIAGLFHRYTGPGFQEGNGDIEWRLLINRTYAIHLGNVLVSLGSQQRPYPVDGGIFVQSGNLIQYLVNVPNLSGGILPINSQIVCGLEGLFYARS